LVSDWELVSPDIDADTCRHYTMNYKEKSVIRLYVSARDKMLPLSQMLFGGYYRLGEDIALVALRARGSHKSGAHEQESGTDATKAAEAMDSNLDPELFEKIDFTEIDQGFRGHSIPYDLIAHMIANGKPGPGLKLEPAKFVKLNRLTRLVSRKLEADEENMPRPIFCKRVVRAAAD
ncbi:MAG TPA: alpha/beta hydrolase, partial [Chroococcales cyanobacterium]